MHAPYWGLTESPFQTALDPRWFHETPGHEEALARLFYLVEERRRCGVLAGPAGTGKSLLVEILSREVHRTQREVATIDLHGRGDDDLLWETAGALGLAPRRNASARDLWRILQDRLQANQFARFPTVLIFDHVDAAREEGLAALQRMIHLTSGAGSDVTFVLAMREKHSLRLAGWLGEVSDLRIELPPLDRGQTQQYVEGLLAKAGAVQTIFEPEAIYQLHQITHGIPRDLNRLCDLSLLAAMADDRRRVDAGVVLAAAEELHLIRLPDPQPTWTNRLKPEDYILTELALQND